MRIALLCLVVISSASTLHAQSDSIRLKLVTGASWHATARKHLPIGDAAQAGGWESTETLQRCYQQPDPATILAVVLGGAELREAQA